MNRSAVVSVVVMVLLAGGCSGTDAPNEHPQVVTTTLTEATSIGGIDDARPEYEFGRVGGVVTLPDGRVAVADVVNHVIRLYDAGGQHLYSFGRTGAGPGELSGPCCLAIDARQRIWVRDGGNARYNVYELHTDSARFLHQVRMAHGDVNRFAHVTFDAAGNVIDIGSRSDAQRVTTTYRFHLDSAGAVVRETPLHKVPPDSTSMKSVQRQIEGGVATMYAYQPYGPLDMFAHSPNGQFVHALSTRYAIDWRAEDASLLRHITYDLPAGPPLSPNERARADTTMQQTAERLGITKAQLGFDVPSRKPPLRNLFFDQHGRLWVELTVPQGAARTAHIYSATPPTACSSTPLSGRPTFPSATAASATTRRGASAPTHSMSSHSCG